MKSTLKKGKIAIKRQFLKASQVYYNLAGNKVECNICHYKANKLQSNIWHLYSSCPNCGSGVRNRLLIAAFDYLNDFSYKKIIDGKNVLHFAPELATRRLIRDKAKGYKTADYLVEGYDYGIIDYQLDITAMKQIPDKSFDCVIACDVLEHVLSVQNGLKEVNRILTDGGYCIFTVPQKDHLEKTLEDTSITDPAERKRLFGQDDHFRIFGNDFADMMKDAGFKVSVVDENSFDQDLVEKYVLAPPVLSSNPLATNYRKVFYGQKV